MADTNTNACAACGASGELHEHHLVPKVDGGLSLPTVMLCLSCHGRVHGRSFGAYHADLTRRGLAAAKARGVKLGNPHLKPGNREQARAAALASSRRASSKAQNIMPYIVEARLAGCLSLGQIAEALMARGIKTPGGKSDWSATQVRRIIRKTAETPARP